MYHVPCNASLVLFAVMWRDEDISVLHREPCGGPGVHPGFDRLPWLLRTHNIPVHLVLLSGMRSVGICSLGLLPAPKNFFPEASCSQACPLEKQRSLQDSTWNSSWLRHHIICKNLCFPGHAGHHKFSCDSNIVPVPKEFTVWCKTDTYHGL